MFNYESLVKKMQRISKSDSEDVVYGNNTTNNLKALGIVIAIMYFLFLFCSNRFLFIFIYSILVVFIFLYVALKRVGILIEDEKIWIVLFKPFSLNEYRIYELPLKRIRFLDVKKRKFFRKIKISFISDEGRLVKLSLRFAGVLYAPGSSNYKTISNNVADKLIGIQKIIDKGDF